MEFEKKVVVITGGSTGIGFSAARMFGEQGANVIILGRRVDKLEEARIQILQTGGGCVAFMTDVSNEVEMKMTFSKIRKIYGKVDVLFANAGINGTWSPLEELPVEEWDKTYAINVRGTFLTMKHGIPLMKQNGGSIVLNASINGTRCFTKRGATAYASSKSAQTTIGKMAALELAPYHIRVNVICPGATVTDIDHETYHVGDDKLTQWVSYPNGCIPLSGNKYAEADQIASAVLFLSSEKASHISGAVLHIDGASSLIM